MTLHSTLYGVKYKMKKLLIKTVSFVTAFLLHHRFVQLMVIINYNIKSTIVPKPGHNTICFCCHLRMVVRCFDIDAVSSTVCCTSRPSFRPACANHRKGTEQLSQPSVER